MLLNRIYRKFHGATVHVAVARRVAKRVTGSTTDHRNTLTGFYEQEDQKCWIRADLDVTRYFFLYLIQIYRGKFFYYGK